MSETALQTEYDYSTAEGQKEPRDEDEALALPATQPVGNGVSDEDLRLVFEMGGPVCSNKSKGTTDRNQKNCTHSSVLCPMLVTVPETPRSGFQKYNKSELPRPPYPPQSLPTPPYGPLSAEFIPLTPAATSPRSTPL